MEVLAVWDTGASCSMISEGLAYELNLDPTGETEIEHVWGRAEVRTYDITITLPNGYEFTGWSVCGGSMKDVDLLIGMDIMVYGDFAVSHAGDTKFTFQIPSTHDTDYELELASSPSSDSKT
jgi:hypothetical protein